MMTRPVLHLTEPETWLAASAGDAAAFETVGDALAAIGDELDRASVAFPPIERHRPGCSDRGKAAIIEVMNTLQGHWRLEGLGLRRGLHARFIVFVSGFFRAPEAFARAAPSSPYRFRLAALPSDPIVLLDKFLQHSLFDFL